MTVSRVFCFISLGENSSEIVRQIGRNRLTDYIAQMEKSFIPLIWKMV